MTAGAWAKPLRARNHHWFSDNSAHALCGAYMTCQVKPSEFGTAAEERRCPTCERKLSYFLAGPGLPATEKEGGA